MMQRNIYPSLKNAWRKNSIMETVCKTFLKYVKKSERNEKAETEKCYKIWNDYDQFQDSREDWG